MDTDDSQPHIKRLERMTSDYWRQMTKSGGAYIPPKRISTTTADTNLPDPSTEAYQRLSWDALRRSINGLVNKVNASNIADIVRELVGENLVRGRGLLIRSLMKAQASSPFYTPVYAALIAVLNTKFPLLGELLVHRLAITFRKGYRRNDKGVCLSATTFIAHLVNQRVLHDICVLQILMLLLERPTDDSVEIAVGLMKEVGASLSASSTKPFNAIFERFRVVLQEAMIDKRVQYMIEVLFQIRKEGFKDHPAIPNELDLVIEEEQITHYVMLDDELDPQDSLNTFKYDPDFTTHEAEYEDIKREIIGNDEDVENEDEFESEEVKVSANEKVEMLQDKTEAALIQFRKTTYLTIMSSLDFEECGHKLLKAGIPEGYELETCHMIIECGSNERNYLKFYGLLAERFCRLDEIWREGFEKSFAQFYETSYKLETNKLRNVAKVFGHLLQTDAITWAVFQCVRLTEEDTTSAGRILLKFLFQDLAEFYGIPKLAARLQEPDFQPYFEGIFPSMEDPHRLTFCINFYTAIGLGGLTDELRSRLDVLQPSEDEEDEEDQGAIEHVPYSRQLQSPPHSPRRRESRSPSPRRHHSRPRSPPGRHSHRRYSRSPSRYRNRRNYSKSPDRRRH